MALEIIDSYPLLMWRAATLPTRRRWPGDAAVVSVVEALSDTASGRLNNGGVAAWATFIADTALVAGSEMLRWAADKLSGFTGKGRHRKAAHPLWHDADILDDDIAEVQGGRLLLDVVAADELESASVNSSLGATAVLLASAATATDEVPPTLLAGLHSWRIGGGVAVDDLDVAALPPFALNAALRWAADPAEVFLQARPAALAAAVASELPVRRRDRFNVAAAIAALIDGVDDDTLDAFNGLLGEVIGGEKAGG